MKIIADMHCHSIASNHAYSTITENALAAKKAGLKFLGITDHGPEMPDSPHIWHFHNYKALPRVIEGVNMIYGIETNILNEDGDVDIDNDTVQNLEWIIASLHEPVFKPSTKESHTNAFLNLCENKYIDVIGHSGNGNYPFDHEKCLKKFKEYGKIVEINEGSFVSRNNSKPNCIEIAKICNKYDIEIIIDSDAHYSGAVGKFDKSIEMLKNIDFKENLILNLDQDKFQDYILKKRGIVFN
ncbi:MAG: phosphatase [Oscillospiraceae bacterium]|nr:phosphatase [Oscillospiraceae bacterium]